MKINEKINEITLATTLGVWGIIIGLSIFIGKKLADFIYSATIGKFRSDIGLIVEEKTAPLKLSFDILQNTVSTLNKEVHAYRAQHHGLIAKNESVLLQTLSVNNEAFEKLAEYDQLLKSKL